MAVTIIRGDAAHLPLADNTVDLIVTSPPYFALRSYQDGGAHYDGQIGSEPTPGEWVDALIGCTREWARVLKPSGSMFVNLGDKYSQRTQTRRSTHQPGMFPGKFEEFAESWADRAKAGAVRMPHQNTMGNGAPHIPEKSLMGLPWRYALRCIDQLGLILRAEIIWAKPNGLPESVTDRVRRSHEQWFHFTLQPRYYSAVDAIRETTHRVGLTWDERKATNARTHAPDNGHMSGGPGMAANPLGKLPGSVWTIPSQPLTVPPHIGVDHFAAFPMEWPRRLIQGWSPTGVCTACGEGRRPVADKQLVDVWHDKQLVDSRYHGMKPQHQHNRIGQDQAFGRSSVTITGEACACTTPDAATTPAVVLDPFGGTGTTALLAHVNGRHGITNDMSADYCRLAQWRTTDPGERAAAHQVDKPEPIIAGQLDLFGATP